MLAPIAFEEIGMKVRMTVAMAGGVSLSPGDEHECDAAEAGRLIEAGYAVPIAPAKPAENTSARKLAAKEQRG